MKKNKTIQEILNKILGQKVNAIKLGHGSMLSIDLGNPVIKEIKTKNGIRSYTHGEWHLWVYMCAWRIDKANKPFIASDDPREQIAKKLQILAGTTITQCEILNASLDTKLYFDNTITLTLFNMNTDDAKQWMLFAPDKNVLVIGPADNWYYEAASKKTQRTPMFYAIASKNKEEVIQLFAKGVNINACDDQGDTPLHKAVLYDDPEMVQLLIDKGANCSALNEQGFTPISLITGIHALEIEKILMASGSPAKPVEKLPLHDAILAQDNATLRSLLESDAIDIDQQNALGETALHWAVHCGNLEITKLLLEKDADLHLLTYKKESALYMAVKYEKLAIIHLLLQWDAYSDTADYKGVGLLHLIAENGNVAIAQALLKAGIFIHKVDSAGCTPLHWAARSRKLEIAKLLICYGIDVFKKNIQQKTALDIALDNNQHEVAQFMELLGVGRFL